ncbi:MAG: hypothetical protein SNJ81_10780 [Cyanobacteriota bacterium]
MHQIFTNQTFMNHMDSDCYESNFHEIEHNLDPEPEFDPSLATGWNIGLKWTLGSAIALAGVIGLPLLVAPAQAQTVTSLAPGAIAQISEERVGRINPARPIRIEIINGGRATIAAALTQPASAERQIAPNSQTAFGTTTTSFLPLPINLLVYPLGTNIGLSVDVLVEGNVIQVIVGEQLSDDSGTINLSVDENGNVLLI